jgi:hypothetical protein
MSDEHKIEEEEIITFLLGELNEERAAQIEKALNENPRLRDKKRILAGTLGLLEASSKDPIPALADQEWKLSEYRKNNIFSSGSAEAEERRFPNLLFWVPLGVAACALLIVLASNPNETENMKIASGNEKEIKPEKTSTSKIAVNEKANLNEMLLDRTQEGITRVLSARTTTEVQAMKEDLKQPPSLGDAFASNDILSSLADPQVMSKKYSSTNNALFSIGGEETLLRNAKSPSTEKEENRAKTNKLPNMGFADGKINPPAPAEGEPIIDSKVKKIASENTESDRSNSELSEFSVLEATLANRAAIPDPTTDFKTAEVLTTEEKVINGYELIDGSKSVFIFTPKGKAIGRVKLVGREDKNIELVRLHKTRAGESVLPKGEGYQLRFSFDKNPPIILVGNLEIKERGREKENPNNFNTMTTYIFQIKDSWILNEKEIRKLIDLNQTP